MNVQIALTTVMILRNAPTKIQVSVADVGMDIEIKIHQMSGQGQSNMVADPIYCFSITISHVFLCDFQVFVINIVIHVLKHLGYY